MGISSLAVALLPPITKAKYRKAPITTRLAITIPAMPPELNLLSLSSTMTDEMLLFSSLSSTL